MRRTQSGPSGIVLLVIGVVLAIVLTASKADETDAIRTAEQLGYTDVRVVDESSFLTNCGKHSTEYELAAHDQHEHPVHLIACCLSDCTVRLKD